MSVRSFHVPATPGHLCLAAKAAFGTDFASDARDFAGESVQLIDHGVDGVFQLENFASHIDRDLAAQVAAGYGRRHLCDIAHLAREV